MVRLAIKVEPPPPPYGQLFVTFFGFDYEYMCVCFKTDLAQEKSHFHSTTRISNSSKYWFCSVKKWSDSGIAKVLKATNGMKNAFLDPFFIGT